MLKHVSIFVLLIILTTACSLQKRHYRKGFHISCHFPRKSIRETPPREQLSEHVTETAKPQSSLVTHRQAVKPAENMTPVMPDSFAFTKKKYPDHNTREKLKFNEKPSASSSIRTQERAPQKQQRDAGDQSQAKERARAASIKALFFFLALAGTCILTFCLIPVLIQAQFSALINIIIITGVSILSTSFFIAMVAYAIIALYNLLVSRGVIRKKF